MRRQRPPRFEAERDVFGDGEIGKQRGLLIDHGDAEGVRLHRVVMFHHDALQCAACRNRAPPRP